MSGTGSVCEPQQKTFKAELPYPFRLDEVLASREYKLADEQVPVGDVVCTLVERAGLDRLWLDPKRGYCIVQREWHWDIGKPLKVRITNGQFRQMLEGLWLPTHSRVEYYGTPETAPGELCVVAELTVSELEVNISDEVFVPNLPARTFVQDYERNISWLTPAELTPATLEETVAKADEYVFSRPDQRGRSPLLIIVFGILLFAALVAAILWYRRTTTARRARS